MVSSNVKEIAQRRNCLDFCQLKCKLSLDNGSRHIVQRFLKRQNLIIDLSNDNVVAIVKYLS